jgi:hypothetical protein
MEPLPPVNLDEPMTAELNEREIQESADFDWATTDPEVQQKYAGLYVAVNRKKVWGSGKTLGDAVRSALAAPGCPGREHLATPYIIGDGGHHCNIGGVE